MSLVDISQGSAPEYAITAGGKCSHFDPLGWSHMVSGLARIGYVFCEFSET